MCECVVYFDRILFISRFEMCFVVRGLVRSYARVSDGVYFDLCAACVCVCVGLRLRGRYMDDTTVCLHVCVCEGLILTMTIGI